MKEHYIELSNILSGERRRNRKLIYIYIKMPNWGEKKKKKTKGKSPQLFHSLLIKLKIKTTCEILKKTITGLPLGTD